MPSINMIAARRAEKEKLKKRVRIMLLMTVCELTISLALVSFMTARILSAKIAIGHLDRELTKIQPTVDEIHYYESQIAELEPKLSLLADSRESTLLWSSVLKDLSHSMPQNTWLSTLATMRTTSPNSSGDGTSTDTKMVLNLRGVSNSQRLVGEAMLRIGQFPEFESVDLNYTQKGKIQDTDTVEFDMAAKLKQNEPARGEVSKDVTN